MTALRCPVWIPDQHVRMDYRLSLIERDIAAHPNHFVLTVDGNLFVHFALWIEPPQRCSIESSDRGEMGARNAILLGKLQQAGISLVSLVEDDRVLFCGLSGIQQLDLHSGRFALWNGFRRGDVVAWLLLRIARQAGNSNECQHATELYYLVHSFATFSRDDTDSSALFSVELK